MKIQKREYRHLLVSILLSYSTLGFYRSELPVVQIENYEQAPIKYYGEDITTTEAVDLKEKLRKILTSTHTWTTDGLDQLAEVCESENCYAHTTLGYKRARQILFSKVYQPDQDRHEVTEVYCGKKYTDGELINGNEIHLQENQIPNGNILNTEHTWPRSRFNVDEEESHDLYEQMLSDIHHLYPTDTVVNRDRYNHQFADVDVQTSKLTCDGPKLGHNNQEADTMFFEPPANIKGDIARSLMYFSIKYNLPIDTVEESALRNWHHSDPVSQFEIRRNNIVHEYQGTRNPFIDFPELERKISDF